MLRTPEKRRCCAGLPLAKCEAARFRSRKFPFHLARECFTLCGRKRGQPLGHLSNRKNVIRPIFSKPVSAAALQTISAG